jgi:hypothetical protein
MLVAAVAAFAFSGTSFENSTTSAAAGLLIAAAPSAVRFAITRADAEANS